MPSERELRDLQQELSARLGAPETCESCVFFSIAGPAPLDAIEVPWCAARVQLCSTCRQLPRRSYAWIADVPFTAFAKYASDNWDIAWCLDDLKEYLPKQPERGGFRFL